MRLANVVAAASRRGVRVLAITLVLTAVACCEGTDSPMSLCILGTDGKSCYVPKGEQENVTVKYVPAGSSCASCESPCKDVQTAVLDDQDGCVGSCKFVCP